MLWNIFIREDFEKIDLRAPQDSIVRPIMRNNFFGDFSFFLFFFFCIRKASVHKFSDDNALQSFKKSVTLLVEKPKVESKKAIKWFSYNKMIVYPSKFKIPFTIFWVTYDISIAYDDSRTVGASKIPHNF